MRASCILVAIAFLLLLEDNRAFTTSILKPHQQRHQIPSQDLPSVTIADASRIIRRQRLANNPRLLAQLGATNNDNDAATAIPVAATIVLKGRLIGAAVIPREERLALAEIIQSTSIRNNDNERSYSIDLDETTEDDWIDLSVNDSDNSNKGLLPLGGTGRVAIIELDADVDAILTTLVDAAEEGNIDQDDLLEDMLEEWKATIGQHIDEILYRNSDSIQDDNVDDNNDRSFQQPILLSVVIANNNTSSSTAEKATISTTRHHQDSLVGLIQEQVRDYGLADAVEKQHEIVEIPATTPAMFVPSHWYEVDGAMVVGENKDTVWDTSSALVFDNLLSSDKEDRNLRERMLNVVLGRDNSNDNDDNNDNPKWDDAKDGPDPSRWISGGLMDLPSYDDDDDGNNQMSSNSNAETDASIPDSYGLSEEAMYDICEDDPPPPAFQEFEVILSDLFPDFVVSRLPEAVLGGGVTPLTANAPCFGQNFDYHIDADPYSAPPSPWTDVYGRYANRSCGKPRFMSCLIYLNDEWDYDQWGAPTRFLDVATNTEIDVTPKPGRVVLMDQDITHTVVAPLEAAGKRPRYSLVWKLILHPKKQNQDMRDLSSSHSDWPSPVLVGSAKR